VEADAQHLVELLQGEWERQEREEKGLLAETTTMEKLSRTALIAV
jgi:hypothetical protein